MGRARPRDDRDPSRLGLHAGGAPALRLARRPPADGRHGRADPRSRRRPGDRHRSSRRLLVLGAVGRADDRSHRHDPLTRKRARMPDNHGPIAPHQQRAFEAARRAATPLCPGYDRRPTRFGTARTPSWIRRSSSASAGWSWPWAWPAARLEASRSLQSLDADMSWPGRRSSLSQDGGRSPSTTPASPTSASLYRGAIGRGPRSKRARCGSILRRCRSCASSPGTRPCGSSRSFVGKDTGLDEQGGTHSALWDSDHTLGRDRDPGLCSCASKAHVAEMPRCGIVPSTMGSSPSPPSGGGPP